VNILYITDHVQIARSGGIINDYQNDLVFYGLRELFGDSVVDSTQIISLYKEFENKIEGKYLWGKMTTFWLIGENNIDRKHIKKKIRDKYYDLIIYGAINRCKDHYNIVSLVYPDNKVILIDGSDEAGLNPLYEKHPYFKRELTIKHKNLIPVSFAIPTCKITTAPNKNKTKDYATVIPGKPETYIFKDEFSYYADYNQSFYGITMKKAGWDTLRHYEILANYCIPFFYGLEDCPADTLFNLPKELLLEGRELANKFDEQVYFRILDDLFEYTKNYLTTKKMAGYIMEKVV
jgi:hypothetical protein